MNQIHSANWKRSLVAVIGVLLILRLIQVPIESAEKDGATDTPLERWLKPQEWRRDSQTPALALGEKGRFDDQHMFAPHVIQQGDKTWRRSRPESVPWYGSAL